MNNSFIFRGNDYSELFKNFGKIKLTSCICCKSKDLDIWTNFDGFTSNICNNCNLIFMNPQLDKEGLKEFYENYIGETRLNNKKKMEQRSIQYKLDAKVLLKFVDKGNILDIGCSGGYFLKNISDNFKKYGTELDPIAFQIAKETLNIDEKNIHLGDVLNCSFNDNFFDVVTMRGVIEHVPDPIETIKKVSQLMKSGGLFYICATPNGESFAAKLYKQNWNLFHPIEHLWHFSKRNISLLTEVFDLKLIWSDYPYIGTPYENIYEDVKLINDKIESVKMDKTNNNISPPFFENMMSLIFKKK